MGINGRKGFLDVVSIPCRFTFWGHRLTPLSGFRPQITPQSEAPPEEPAENYTWDLKEDLLRPEIGVSEENTLLPVAIGIAEQLQILQIHSLWAQRVDKDEHPWIWEVPSDKTDLVSELTNKYLDEVRDVYAGLLIFSS